MFRYPRDKELFQFSPLREGRLHEDCVKDWLYEFQFSPLREGRHVETASNGGGYISILAPARGATWPMAKSRSLHQYFNSRPCERGDG